MTKKNIRPSPKKGSAKTTVITKPAIIREESPQKKIFLIAGILIITFLVYFPSLHNELLKTWDDQAYVTHNDLIKSLSFDNIKRIFREDRGLYANYHPLTTLSLAVNFQFSKLDSPGYHVTNLLFHLLNTLLVFIFIYKLCGRRLEIAAVVSLLFGLNPMHVESVSWISERKDVLYTFFFLLSVIAYQYYLKRNDFKFYFLSILLFLCSLLSKAMAASLPLVLLLIDYFLKRK